jgi:lysophospholipid acyltransferase (LPLAT)-like uncharacterized protein
MFGKSERTKERSWRLIGFLGKNLVNLIGKTLRIRFIQFEKVREVVASRRFIIAVWHSRIFLGSFVFQGWEGTALVSSSKDGEITARILQRQGHKTIRGSTSRNAVRALARLIRALRKEVRPAVVVPDGPQGPRYKVQTGVITLAQKTGYPIVPISCSAKRLKIFDSWDRFILPFPFSEAAVIYGAPLMIPGELDEDSREFYRVRLEEEMNRITRAVDRSFGHRID